MAEAIITHFKDFEEGRSLEFSRRVMQTVGREVYGLAPQEVTTRDITLIVIRAGLGSETSAISGTEVKIDLDDEEWPTDNNGLRGGPESAKEKCEQLKRSIGEILLGGVNGEQGAVVNIWVRQFHATGWYGEGYQA